MSDPQNALGGALFESHVTVREMPVQGMITLRGDLAARPLAKAVKSAVSLDVPGVNGVTSGDGASVCWMSPDELLILGAYADATDHEARLRNALGDTHSLVVNVSDARSVFRVEGAGAREVIAKLAPIDMSFASMPAGRIRRTRFAQVPAAIWMLDDTTAQVICFRSVARYMFDLLSTAAAPGSEVGAL